MLLSLSTGCREVSQAMSLAQWQAATPDRDAPLRTMHAPQWQTATSDLTGVGPPQTVRCRGAVANWTQVVAWRQLAWQVWRKIHGSRSTSVRSLQVQFGYVANLDVAAAETARPDSCL